VKPPVWLLDIDGVLNAMSTNLATHVWRQEDWVIGEAQGGNNIWKIAVRRQVCDFIREVHEKDLAEIRWHSTWQHQAENVAKLLDLPTFPVHPAPEFRHGHWASSSFDGTWWKLAGAERVLLEEDRPLVWTDDDIDYYLEDAKLTSLREFSQALLVCPDHKCGLVQKELDKIRKFLESFQTSQED
jgi:hypothetical protein